MGPPESKRGPAGGLAADARRCDCESAYSPQPPSRQIPPREHHALIADDKLVLFEVPPVHRLAGHVQGPGRLGELLRAGHRL
jgi:hypothetical protein